jgi:hypothetical protein
MPLTGKSAEEIEALESAFLGGVPEDGTHVGNIWLRKERLKWEAGVYLAIKKRLLDKGAISLGRGQGGSVRRTEVVGPAWPEPLVDVGQAAHVEQTFLSENSLYAPIGQVLVTRWAADQPFDNVLVEQTDRGGRRADGVWSRPDFTIAAMTSYTYVPGRHFDVVTFEVKHHTGFDVTAIYEALAHRRSATRSYVLAYIPEAMSPAFEDSILPDVREEASRQGIGLIVAGDPGDYDTSSVLEDATRVNPDPARMNAFIRSQLSEGTKDQIV